MRFMMLMIPRVYQGKEGQTVPPDFAPSAEDVARMTEYNEDLAKAGALVGLDGFHPPATAARVSFRGGKGTVAYGPITGTGDVLGGYWMINVKSKEEAIAWASKCPAGDGDVIEVRQVFDVSDFPPDVKEAAKSPAVEQAVRPR